MPGALKEDAPN